jgi:hypothetical protein
MSTENMIQREKELDAQIKLKISNMEENNREHIIEAMILIDERYHLTDSVEEFNSRLKKQFRNPNLPVNATREEIFSSATDDELNAHGL